MSALFHLRPRPPDLDAERDRVLSLVRRTVPHADVREVGSTAVPGLLGKQDIDLLVRVDAPLFEETRSVLDAAFARDLQQLSNEQYQGYRVASHHDVALQFTVTGGAFDSFLPFLEELRRRPALVEAFNELKRHWDGKPMAEYRRAKAGFIEQVLAEMREPRQGASGTSTDSSSPDTV